MRNKKLTEDMLDDLKNDYGILPTTELVKKYNCSYSTIERFCKSHGFKSKRQPTYKTKNKYEYLHEHIDEFFIDWENNVLTEDELVQKYKAPMTALYSQAKLYGKNRKTLEEQIDVLSLIDDYQSKELSQQELCDKYGISNSTKSKILKNNNIDIEPAGIRRRKYFFDEHFLDVIDSEEKAYFLGFVYADGGHSTDRCTLNITLQQRDADLLLKFYSMFQCERDIRYIHNKQYDKYYVNFCLQSTYLSDKLLQLGVQANKSFKITFPNFLPQELHRHFIRGYFDGDGCIGFSNRGWKSTSVEMIGNEPFINAIKDIIYSETGKMMRMHKKTNSGVYEINSSGIFNVYSILNYLYKDATIYLQRKYDRYVNFMEQYKKERLDEKHG